MPTILYCPLSSTVHHPILTIITFNPLSSTALYPLLPTILFGPLISTAHYPLLPTNLYCPLSTSAHYPFLPIIFYWPPIQVQIRIVGTILICPLFSTAHYPLFICRLSSTTLQTIIFFQLSSSSYYLPLPPLFSIAQCPLYFITRFFLLTTTLF